ncbi:MAG: TonB family protein [Candidatus Acidiferrales bacterium]|jgi:TonB family protein
MYRMIAMSLQVCLLALPVPQMTTPQNSSQPLVSGWTIERILRSRAVKVVKPIFPEDAIRNQTTGVVVAEIHLDGSGVVTTVHILQAPSESTAASVSQAVSQWQFQPFPPPDDKHIISGKLTFYFEFRHGKGIVLDPAETGYVGHWAKK